MNYEMYSETCFRLKWRNPAVLLTKLACTRTAEGNEINTQTILVPNWNFLYVF